MTSIYQKIRGKLIDWLTYEPIESEIMPYDFNRLKYEIRPGDVLLVAGRSRVSHVIRTITQSPWTHAALYIGRLVDFEDEEIKKIIKAHIRESDKVTETTRLIIEDMIDSGTIVSPLNVYNNHHLRICRPIGITPTDINGVIDFAVHALGQPYNVRHLLDLTRFVLPWSLLPRRWGSSLFRTASGAPEGAICSSLIAEAFTAVHFPILPFIKPDEAEGLEMFQRNPYLFAPKDFDYSPYFQIIKYPLFNPEEPLPYYRRLPWAKNGFQHQDSGILSAPREKKLTQEVNEKPDDKKAGSASENPDKKDDQDTNDMEVTTLTDKKNA